MLKPTHLTDEAANVLAGALDERVYFIQSKRWIAYPKAVRILDHLNKLLKHPRTTRMPSLIDRLWRQRDGEVHAGGQVQSGLRDGLRARLDAKPQ
jgi:hypothetical protein